MFPAKIVPDQSKTLNQAYDNHVVPEFEELLDAVAADGSAFDSLTMAIFHFASVDYCGVFVPLLGPPGGSPTTALQ